MRLVLAAIAPSTLQTNAACPFSAQGWKWSLASIESKPAASAAIAKSSSSLGPYCSVPAFQPSCSMLRLLRYVPTPALLLGLIVRRRLALPREHCRNGEADCGNRCQGAPSVGAQVLGGHLSGVAAVLGELLLKRTEPLLDSRQRVAGPLAEPRKLFTRLVCGLSQQLACVAREDLHVRKQVPHRTLHRLVVGRA